MCATRALDGAQQRACGRELEKRPRCEWIREEDERQQRTLIDADKRARRGAGQEQRSGRGPCRSRSRSRECAPRGPPGRRQRATRSRMAPRDSLTPIEVDEYGALTLKRCPPRIAPEYSSVALGYHENALGKSPPNARKWHVILACSESRTGQGFPRVATPKKICARA